MSTDPTRDAISAPLAAYDAVVSDQQPLGAAVSAFVQSITFTDQNALSQAILAAVQAGPAPTGQTPTLAQAMAAAFLNHTKLIKAVGTLGVLAFKQTNQVGGIAMPCGVDAVFTDSTTFPFTPPA